MSEQGSDRFEVFSSAPVEQWACEVRMRNLQERIDDQQTCETNSLDTRMDRIQEYLDELEKRISKLEDNGV